MIQATTALRKIARLKKRIWVVQGGQGAGKTFAILLLLLNHAVSKPDREIIIASAELSKMRITVIKDFLKILRELGTVYNSADTLFRFPNGSFIKFIGLDKEDIGKGLRSHVVFINEANKINFETYRELTSRAERVIVDFNPNAEFWAHVEVITRPDADFLILTYKDNEYLSEQERKEIEIYQDKAYHNKDLKPRVDIESNIKSKYWHNKWQVYGLGVIGTNPNRIFFWEEIDDEAYHKIEATKYYGVDWGTVDPWAIGECKYYDGAFYVHELNHASENQLREQMTPDERAAVEKDEGIVPYMFTKLGIPKKNYVICDTNRPLKIQALFSGGWHNASGAPKMSGSILDGINILNDKKVYYTKSSANIKREQMNYSRQVDRYGIILEEPVDFDNHQMDWIRYVALFLKALGFIK